MESDWRKEKRDRIDKFFIPANLVPGSHSESCSPCGQYLLSMDGYSTGKNTWNYSRGIVTQISTGKVIADIKRNYGGFWHAWIQHNSEQKYLVCGEDYQGYTVIDLVNEESRIHLPDSAKNGAGFCWAGAYPSSDGMILAIEGCVWAGPYDLVFYDFSEPMRLPLPELGRVNEIGKVIGWKNDSVFAVEHEFEVRKSDGKRFELLTEAEQDASPSEYKIEILYWNRNARSLTQNDSAI